LKGWRSSLNDTRSASLCRRTMSKSNMCICSPSLELKLSWNCLYFLIHSNTYPEQQAIVYNWRNQSGELVQLIYFQYTNCSVNSMILKFDRKDLKTQ
jgi:hypothetical protein